MFGRYPPISADITGSRSDPGGSDPERWKLIQAARQQIQGRRTDPEPVRPSGKLKPIQAARPSGKLKPIRIRSDLEIMI